MTRRLFVLSASPLILTALAACEPVPGTSGPTLTTVPDSVAAVAAPYQDLGKVRIRAEDGCYWYTHSGPVETTELPLRTSAGNPICTRPQS